MSTREPQYARQLELKNQFGLASLGLCSSQAWRDDPKHLMFTMARYKFVARMFAGFDRVLEIGCGDAFATHIVRQAVSHVTAIDFDTVFIESARDTIAPQWPITAMVHDILQSALCGGFDGVYCLDVFEHIAPAYERQFLKNVKDSIRQNGVMILGSPSVESQAFASPLSSAGHVNCKTHESLLAVLREFFHNVFIFSMNDEVVHTGYSKLAHYRLALCCNKVQ